MTEKPAPSPYNPQTPKQPIKPAQPLVKLPTPPSAEKVIAEHQETYGDSWLLTGRLLQTLNLTELQKTPYMFNWMVMLHKMFRILVSPLNRDHWVDLAGYATLVYTHIDKETKA